jgi:hypothetical protein
MWNELVLLAYGGVAIAGVFMLWSFSRIIGAEWRECRRLKCKPLEHRPLLMAVGLLVMSFGLLLVALIRVHDALVYGDDLGGSSPATLFVGLALIWLAKSTFQWAAAIGSHQHWAWRLYLLCAFAWVVTVVVTIT